MKTISFTYENDNGDEVVGELPGKYEVCSRCEGEGTHTNPNIDGNGITASEWAEWDEDSRESYLSGAYDVVCEVCGGARVVLEVDAEHADPELLRRYDDALEAGARHRAEERNERRIDGYDRDCY